MGNYYLYRHIRLDKNEPFYIGVGSHYPNTKPYYRAYCFSRRNKVWKSIISITPYKVEIVLDDLTKEEAFKKEKEFIGLYKRLTDNGVLSNLSLGGEGGACGHSFQNDLIGKKNKSIAAFNRSEEIIRNKAKSYIIITPEDIVFKIFNLDKFCRENNLDSSNLIKVASKKINHCKRWRCYFIDEPIENYFYFTRYLITHNNNSFIINNMTSFIKDNNLDRANVQKVLNKSQKQTKGFTIEPLL